MSFSLTNTPAIFQELINDTLREYLNDFVIVYLDDVLIFSKIYKEYVEHVKKVFTKLQEKSLPVKLEKCKFHKYSIKFLRYMVSKDGLIIDLDKIKSVLEQEESKNIKDV